MALLLSGTRIYGTANVDSTLVIGNITPNTSISNTTGSLVVTGGVGISGNIYSGGVYITGAGNGITFVDGTVQTTASSGSTDTTARNLASYAANTANSASANTIVTQGVDATQNTQIIALQTLANTDYTNITTTAGVYGNSTFVPVITVAANGRIVSVTNTAITVSGGGSNSLPNTGSVITVNSSSQLVVANTTASTSNATGSLVVQGGLGVQGNMYSSNVYVLNDIITGTQDGSSLGGATNPIIHAIANTNNYVQTYIINYSNTSQASADFVAYPNNGADSAGYIDMGITSNAFSQAAYAVTGRNEGYLFMSAPVGSGTSGNLVISTDSSGIYNSIEFYAGGFNLTKGNAGVIITTQNTSVSNTTGTLIVNGGLGVRGNVYTGNHVITGSGNGITFVDGTRMNTANALVPAGGSNTQVLTKASANNFDTTWATLFSGGLLTIQVVTSLPGSPNANTLYIVAP